MRLILFYDTVAYYGIMSGDITTDVSEHLPTHRAYNATIWMSERYFG